MINSTGFYATVKCYGRGRCVWICHLFFSVHSCGNSPVREPGSDWCWARHCLYRLLIGLAPLPPLCTQLHLISGEIYALRNQVVGGDSSGGLLALATLLRVFVLWKLCNCDCSDVVVVNCYIYSRRYALVVTYCLLVFKFVLPSFVPLF